MSKAILRLSGLLTLLLVLGGQLPAATAQPAGPAQPVSFWGMNAYLTKRERIGRDNPLLLGDVARDVRVAWTREELPWDLIEPTPGDLRGIYDQPLLQVQSQGFHIIGVLQTTPGWARDGSCARPGSYFCPPANAGDFGRFAGWMAERYDGDGHSDAPGSPRIAAWQIWNEPNDFETWPDLGADPSARERRYGEMLVAAYAAIKAADPSAIVATGGMYIYDGGFCGFTCDGLKFMSPSDGVLAHVPAARYAFDVFAIHPYIPTAAPDQPGLPQLITVEGRIWNTQRWLAEQGRADAPVWISEIGWCTKSAPSVRCPGDEDPAYVPTSEDRQADYLIRALVVAQQRGVQHASWFQLDDAFDDPGRMWGYAAIVRDFDGTNYPAKPAYLAYRTLAGLLDGAVPAGVGPLHTHHFDVANPYNPADSGIYNYRYTRGDTVVDVLWQPSGQQTLALPVAANRRVSLVDRNTARTLLVPVDGAVAVAVSETPQFIIQEGTGSLIAAPTPLVLLVETAAASTGGTLAIRGSAGQLSWQASSATAWLNLSPTTGGGDGLLRVEAARTHRGPGTYHGQITLSSAAGTHSVPVQLKVVTTLQRAFIPLVGR